jgi:hypothetical protein
MIQQQLGQVAGVLGIILGPAGDKGLAIFLEGNRVDGIERDPGISFQEGDQMNSRLLQAQGDAGVGMLLAQIGQPFPDSLGGRVQGMGGALAVPRLDEVEIRFAIGTVQADDQVIR